MDFKKKFDHTDINNFLPDNKTIGTKEYFEKKFEGLPSYMHEILSVKSRIEYNNQDIESIIELVKKSKKEEDKKLMDEYCERVKLIDDFTEIILNDNITILQDAKYNI